jgi:hypothetical protein
LFVFKRNLPILEQPVLAGLSPIGQFSLPFFCKYQIKKYSEGARSPPNRRRHPDGGGRQPAHQLFGGGGRRKRF